MLESSGTTSDFINDLATVNDCEMFQRNFKRKFPPELELKNEGYRKSSLSDKETKIFKAAVYSPTVWQEEWISFYYQNVFFE